MKRPQIYMVALLMLATAAVFGCTRKPTRFEKRREFDIAFNTQMLRSTKSPVASKYRADILSALTIADKTNILQPRLASAVLVKGTNTTYSLFVFWMEDYPSVSGIEFTCPGISPTNAEWQIELKEVQAEAKSGIVYGNQHNWNTGAEMWKHLERISNTNGLGIRLLHGAKPATDWFHVSFFHMTDHWVSDRR